MAHWLLTFGLWISAIIPFIIAGYFHRRAVRWQDVFLFVCLFILDVVLMVLVMNYLHFRTEMPWHLKLVSMAWALCFIFLYRSLRLKDYGVTLHLLPGSLRPVVFVFIVTTVGLLVYFGGAFTHASIERIAFEATLPGIAEELTFRGIFLALLNRAYGKTWNFFGARIGWGAIITTVLFAIMHGVLIDESFGFHFMWFPVCITGFFGAIFCWMRERTDSVFPGMIAHNVFNVVSIV
jgi:CAAX protease family protein